ncbi:MAG: ArsR family transcriptional regulator [Bradyrhizobium sp.]|nr:ArsR family transcriptional regulator [Bradyrhizobium sp.]
MKRRRRSTPEQVRQRDERVRALRDSGMTVQQIAKKLGMTQSNVYMRIHLMREPEPRKDRAIRESLAGQVGEMLRKWQRIFEADRDQA